MGFLPNKPTAAFLRTKVARRVLLLFFLCAMAPLGLWAVYGYIHVSSELYQNSRERVLGAATNTKHLVVERLQFLEMDLSGVAAGLMSPELPTADISASAGPVFAERFRGIVLQTADGSIEVIHGDEFTPPTVSVILVEHLMSGAPGLVSRAANERAMVLLGRLVDPRDPRRGTLWGQVDSRYLAVAGEDQPGKPDQMDLCLLDRTGLPVHCTVPVPRTVIESWRDESPSLEGAFTVPEQFDWIMDGNRYVAGATQVSLRFSHGYEAPGLTLVFSESRATVLAPMVGFMRQFPLTVVLAILIVLYLANVQIRQSMGPVEELSAGTKRIAARDFESRVVVESKDEFQDLAASFNTMADRLGRQFNALTTINEIDRAVLSALDQEEIIDTVLQRSRGVIACDGVALCLAQGAGDKKPWTLFAADAQGRGRGVKSIRMSADDLRRLEEHPEFFFADPAHMPAYLDGTPFAERGIRSFVVLPIFLKQQLAGLIGLGYADRPDLDEEDLVQARQLTDQVAVALSNARLIDELDQFNWGALAALAQTVDAKSPWTAGHSQRVTRLSLLVARKMALSADQIDVLHRGGLLHDIGKIGVPAEILDKPGALTPDEMQIMRDHVTVGARILTPIAAYADMIPIVLRHHERLDGTGYPDGLMGDDIPFLARLLAVPDVFDALTSDRPYRNALPRENALDFLQENTGTHFEPEVMRAFEAVMAEPEPEIPEDLSLVFPRMTA
jgi:putative nucleotidyltransferase with HDIG domain